MTIVPDAPARADALGRLAQRLVLLPGGLQECGDALTGLAEDLGLTSLLLRGASGHLLAVVGDPAAAVPSARALVLAGSSVDVPVLSGGVRVARLTAGGARAEHLPVLRGAAAVLGLALFPPLARALVADQEQDREGLADSFHDGPVQAMVVARYACDAVLRFGPETAASAAVARDAVQEGLVEARQALGRIRGRGRDGLVAALDTLSRQRVEVGGEPVQVEGDLDLPDLPLDVTSSTYRLVQALARTDARPVRVRLEVSAAAVLVTIDGGELPREPDDLARWSRRLQAVGAGLTREGDTVLLALPLTPQPTPLPIPLPTRTSS